MADVKSKWLTFYQQHLETISKETFGHVEKMIVGTLIISAGAHVSSDEPAIVIEVDYEADTTTRLGVPDEHRH